jgi:hypothetical protein
LSDEERSLGFIIAFVNNPNAVYSGHGSIVPAVIFPVRPGNLLIKVVRPDDNVIEYSHRIYGSYENDPYRPQWRPILIPIASAGIAVQAALKD